MTGRPGPGRRRGCGASGDGRSPGRDGASPASRGRTGSWPRTVLAGAGRGKRGGRATLSVAQEPVGLELGSSEDRRLRTESVDTLIARRSTHSYKKTHSDYQY